MAEGRRRAASVRARTALAATIVVGVALSVGGVVLVHVLAGNALKRQQIKYDEANVLGRMERIQSAFTAELSNTPMRTVPINSN